MGAAISMVLAAFNLGEWVSHDDVHGLLPIAGRGLIHLTPYAYSNLD